MNTVDNITDHKLISLLQVYHYLCVEPEEFKLPNDDKYYVQ